MKNKIQLLIHFFYWNGVDDDDNISHLWEVKGLFRRTLLNYRKLRITESHNHDLSKTVKQVSIDTCDIIKCGYRECQFLGLMI